MTERKAFSQTQSIDIVYPNEKSVIVVSMTKRTEIIMSIQVCLIPWMTIYYNENDGKKSISCKSKASISCIPMERT